MLVKAMADEGEPPFSLLEESGSLRSGTEPLPDADALRLYRGMLHVRLVDERFIKLQRQGRLGFFMTSTGEEATHFAVHALRPTDWVFPSYRETGSYFYRGYTLAQFANQLYGNAGDWVKGRQMPVHHTFREGRVFSISSPVGTQIPQAAGLAIAARISGKDDVALVYFGDGATSTGDFHAGLNFAGVQKAPCIFFCRNNGWAISTPSEKQSAGRVVAHKAVAYGMPGVRIDGNDLYAILAAMDDAVARARAGEGPTLIEAVTYRRGAHSTSDDPSRYRDADEPKRWEALDPIDRFRRHLEKRGLWNQEKEDALRNEITGEIVAAIAAAEALPPPDLDTLFEDVYAEVPPHLLEQKRELLSMPRARVGHGGH